MSLSLSQNFDLTNHNSFQLRGSSAYARAIVDEAELPQLFEVAEELGVPVRILGGGSNVILSEQYDGITAIMSSRGRSLADGGNGQFFVEASAGENWHELVAWTVEQGLWGLENLAGIPGTVGAAPIQNIGAYGVELSDLFESLVAFDRAERRFVSMDGPSCRFAYRQSLFKQEPGRYVVTSVRLKVSQSRGPSLGYRDLSALGPLTSPSEVMQAVLRLRASKLPDWRILGNAGSFFHNPVLSADAGQAFTLNFPNAPAFPQPDGSIKLSAGWLIEQAGLKGYRRGAVGVFERHALVLVNHGGATCKDILELSDFIMTSVRSKFGIALRREPELF